MAILDYQLRFENGVGPGNIGTNASTNVVDTGIANSNLGAGDIWVVVEVDTTCTSATTNSTLAIVLQDSAAEGSGYGTLISSEAYAEASLVAGTKLLCARLPAEHQRYLRIAYTVGVANITAGALNCYMTTTPPLNR